MTQQTAPPMDAVCTGCGRRPQFHDSFTHPGAAPDPGDVSFCWKCLAASVYELNPLGVLVLRAPTVDEERELQTDPDIAIALRCRRAHPGDPRGAVADAIAQIKSRDGREGGEDR